VKRIVIDGRMVGPVPHGISRYVTGLAEGLRQVAKRSPLPYEIVFLVNRSTPDWAFQGYRKVHVRSPFLRPWEMLEIPYLLRKLRPALYHSPSFSSLLWCPCPWIVTVHDLNHAKFGGWKERLYYRRVLLPFMLGAEKVVTVSEFSREEISAWSGLRRESIEVACNSIALDGPRSSVPVDPASVLRRAQVEKGRYFLCLANSKPHKNLPILVRGYRRYRNLIGEEAWPLVLCVKGYELEKGVRCLGPVSGVEGQALLDSAGAVISPSTYEGFGLPPVEAAARGIPVVASDIPPHREGLVDLAPSEVAWVAPRDEEGWGTSLVLISEGQISPASEESRAKLLRRYDPAWLGQHMDQIYRRVLGLA
jgi:glycosyltransferase involved in cell wall biosynthesis